MNFGQSKRNFGGAAARGALAAAWLCAAVLALVLMPKAEAAAAAASGGQADRPPYVAVSIRPLHSLVSAVMAGVAAPALIVEGEGSEHGYQLRPQNAKDLSRAEIIFWAGPEMETFLRKPLRVLSPKAEIIALARAPGTQILPARSGGAFAAADGRKRGHEEADAGGAARGHEEDADGDSTHQHGQGEDLHFWLDPENAKAALAEIAAALAAKDPARADIYRRNAVSFRQKLEALTARLNRELQPVRGRPYIVFHDAYQYFERRFAVPAAGALTVNPEQTPGARRVAEIRAAIEKSGAICVFAEPQFEPRLVRTIAEGTKAKTGVLDPLGSGIEAGPGQYITLMQNLADSLKNCLSAE